MALDLDLSRASVFIDFDGTISTLDVGNYLADRFAPPSWRELDDRYVAGEIGSRECLLDLWDLLPKDEARLRAVAREVPLDPGFEPLVEALRRAGADVVVVSDGFGFYAEEVCAPLGLEMLTNVPDWSTGRLEFPHEDRCCPCSTCGTCKQAPLKDARHRGRATVLVGDGASDRKAALLADVVFAKGELAGWCARNGVACRRFETLDDVRAALAPS
jgi:2-hydroxy-3-keto-5-methylthiopentenyl-1-phosphate phosphatase